MSANDRASASVVIRSAIYTVWMLGLMGLLGIFCLPVVLGPHTWVRRPIRLWCRLQIWGLRWIVGLRVEFRGLEHRPAGRAVVAAKHQSQLDTIAPFEVLDDPCYVLKRELMRLPVFGWWAAASEMIPVDRGGGSTAVRALSDAAEAKLAHRPRQILIFPEGTRRAPGAAPAYKQGVAALYRDLNLPCTPVATNSGLFWSARGFLYRPGVAVYEFLEPIPPGLKRAEFMRLLETRIEAASDRLLPPEIVREAPARKTAARRPRAKPAGRPEE